MFSIRIYLFACLFSFFSAITMAPAKADFYFGASLHQTTLEDYEAEYTFDEDDSSAGFGLLIGMKINEKFSVEFAYSDYGDYGFSISDLNNETVKVSASHDALSLSLKANILQKDSLNAYFKLGLAQWDHSVTAGGERASEDGTDILVGLSIEKPINEKTGLLLGYEYVDDAESHTFGLSIIFRR